MSAEWYIKKLEISHVQQIVAVHLCSFEGFFLSFLGPAFLREFYTATIKDTSGIGFVSANGGDIFGFVVGTEHPAGFYRRLLWNRWWRFALASLIPFVRRPSIAPRLLRAFSKPTEVIKRPDRGTLMSIAVLPHMQGTGIGKSLVHAFLIDAAKRGLRQVDVATDSENNDLVNNFYLNLGFMCERTYVTPEGRAMNEYVFDLISAGRTGQHGT